MTIKEKSNTTNSSDLTSSGIVDDYISIQETKNTCNACGKVWFYGKEEIAHKKDIEKENSAAACGNCTAGLDNCATTTMCCSGCAPAVFIPEKQTKPMKEEIDLDKCPNCGSRAIEKGIVTHKVKKLK